MDTTYRMFRGLGYQDESTHVAFPCRGRRLQGRTCLRPSTRLRANQEVYIVETSGVNQHGKPWTDQDRFRQKKHAEMWLAAISKPRA